jgi:hypothetical protein
LAKSKWDEVKNKLILVEGWARDGLIDEQICKNLGISKDTFYKYQKEHSDFADSLKRGKEVVDFEVENALLKRALGYGTKEIIKELTDDGLIITKTIDKQVSPDVTAQIFWLKNRKPKNWRDKQEMQIDNKGNNDDIIRLADLLNRPVKDRPISDFEEEE